MNKESGPPKGIAQKMHYNLRQSRVNLKNTNFYV